MEQFSVSVESGIPLNRLPRKKFMFPFEKMQPGDSFFVRADMRHIDSDRVRSRINAQGYRFAKKHNLKFKFTTRRTSGGYRCWRIDGWDGAVETDTTPIEI